MSMAETAPDLNAITSAEEIPDKLYFRIGDVARLAGIKPYVLRFWETEFPGLGPRKSGTGHRLYRRKDVEMVLEIKRLLYGERFTIEGARKFLESRPKPEAKPTGKGKRAPAPKASRGTAVVNEPIPAMQAGLFDGGPSPMMETVRKELREILQILK
ncbi:MAG TPA: MerR family transcriptional regulator [Bryobacteraceae bacterium]|jgi:DNA-binding transcriptional MerR regulator